MTLIYLRFRNGEDVCHSSAIILSVNQYALFRVFFLPHLAVLMSELFLPLLRCDLWPVLREAYGELGIIRWVCCLQGKCLIPLYSLPLPFPR